MSIIPDRGKRPENTVKSVPGEAVNVFDEREERAEVFDEPEIFEPEPALLSIKPGISTMDCRSDADILAGEAATDDLNTDGIAVVPKSLSGKSSDVVIASDARPVPCKHPSFEGVAFTKRDGSHSGSFEAKTESANS